MPTRGWPVPCGGISGTRSSTGSANTANQRADASTASRMSRPPSLGDGEQAPGVRIPETLDEQHQQQEQQHDAADVAHAPAEARDAADRSRAWRPA